VPIVGLKGTSHNYSLMMNISLAYDNIHLVLWDG
jgi:hypothetical protein